MSLKCVSSCGAGFFKGKSKKCERCALKCKTCNGTASSCRSCDFPYFYTSSDCVTKCPPGFYGNIKERLCKPCDKVCQTCSDGETGDKCRSCPNGLFLSKYLTKNTDTRQLFGNLAWVKSSLLKQQQPTTSTTTFLCPEYAIVILCYAHSAIGLINRWQRLR